MDGGSSSTSGGTSTISRPATNIVGEVTDTPEPSQLKGDGGDDSKVWIWIVSIVGGVVFILLCVMICICLAKNQREEVSKIEIIPRQNQSSLGNDEEMEGD